MQQEEVDAWRQLLLRYLHHCDKRTVRAHFGIDIESIVIVWKRIRHLFIDHGLVGEHLLWLLHYLRVYPTEDQGANWCGITRPTYRKNIWTALILLNEHLNTVSTTQKG